MVTCAIALDLASSVVLHCPTEAPMKVISALLTLDSATHSSVHVWGVESKAFGKAVHFFSILVSSVSENNNNDIKMKSFCVALCSHPSPNYLSQIWPRHVASFS